MTAVQSWRACWMAWLQAGDGSVSLFIHEGKISCYDLNTGIRNGLSL